MATKPAHLTDAIVYSRILGSLLKNNCVMLSTPLYRSTKAPYPQYKCVLTEMVDSGTIIRGEHGRKVFYKLK